MSRIYPSIIQYLLLKFHIKSNTFNIQGHSVLNSNALIMTIIKDLEKKNCMNKQKTEALIFIVINNTQ